MNEDMSMYEDLVRKQAEFFSEEHGRRVARGMTLRAERGELPGCAPVGYRNTWVDGNKSIVLDKVVAPLIREAFELIAGGLSIRKALALMTANGLRSRNGKVISVSSFWNILTNRFYTGQLVYKGVMRQASHEPLIDARVFGEVQAVLSRNRRRDSQRSRANKSRER